MMLMDFICISILAGALIYAFFYADKLQAMDIRDQEDENMRRNGYDPVKRRRELEEEMRN